MRHSLIDALSASSSPCILKSSFSVPPVPFLFSCATPSPSPSSATPPSVSTAFLPISCSLPSSVAPFTCRSISVALLLDLSDVWPLLLLCAFVPRRWRPLFEVSPRDISQASLATLVGHWPSWVPSSGIRDQIAHRAFLKHFLCASRNYCAFLWFLLRSGHGVSGVGSSEQGHREIQNGGNWGDEIGLLVDALRKSASF